MEPEVLPQGIGPYRPVSKLGQGGMGIVYRAEDTRKPGFFVALKVMSRQDFPAGDSVKRFEREAKILESLRHRNIVELFEIGLHGDQSYVAMEMLSGKTLSSYIGKSYRDVLPLFIQFSEGMHYLASRNIIHRDLSPDNIFVVPFEGDRVVKILDFGLAKDTGRTETLFQFTKTGLLMGKPPYWSPELLGNLPKGTKADFRSDIYASGVIFFRVLSAEYPFSGDTPYSYAFAHLHLKPRELVAPAGRLRIPEPLRDLVARMMEKDRKRRPQSFEEVKRVLEEVLALPEETDAVELAAARPEEPVPASPSLTPRTAAPISGTEATVQLPGFGPPSATPFPRGVSEALSGPHREQTEATVLKPPAPPSRTAVISGIAAAAARAAGGLYIAFAPRPAVIPVETPALPAATRPPAEGRGAPGTLTLSAFPWAQVVSITDETTGRPVPLAGEFHTPIALTLDPGRYRLELRGPDGTATKKIEVEIGASQAATANVRFDVAGNPLELLE
ncbi:MAG: protein kinase [Thermoanaerobaculia bacterium]|nr:protein kinase [Thermoanaerobaculia bacterium]